MTKFSAPQQNQLAQIGAFLRDNREKQSKSLEDIAICTYIRPQLLIGIETGNPEMLPEPIFVQGFIRRYGEALGLNGIELSQQFTVTSIPSTPRPAPPAPPEDSATTRLTRLNPTQVPASQAPPATAPMFSAGGMAQAVPQGLSNDRAEQTKEGAMPLPLGKPSFNPVPEPAAISDSFETNSADINNRIDTSVNSSIEQPINRSFDSDINGDTNGDTNGIANPLAEDFDATFGAELQSQPVTERQDDFASRIAAFDQANLNPRFDSPGLESSGLNSPSSDSSGLERDFENELALDLDSSLESDLDSDLENTVFNSSMSGSAPVDDVSSSIPGVVPSTVPTNVQNSVQNNVQSPPVFDDNLPAAFTTQSDQSESFKAPVSHEPVGIEYDRGDQPNLKPFMIGGVVAAIAAAAILLANMLGSNRQPSVANSSQTTEQVNPQVQVAPTAPVVAPKPTTPPASSAPVYVEAKATAEAWVSVIADGNPNPIFEATLKPGESKLWEAQKNISVYSGDAGALTLSANGSKPEVMGERGQPQEKVFPQ